MSQNKPSILIVLSNAVSDFRMMHAASALEAAGYEVRVLSEVPFYTISLYEIIIICRPGFTMCPFAEDAITAGRFVIIDMDDDFNTIPSHNPAYKILGQGNGEYLNHLRAVIKKANILTMPSAEVGRRYIHNAEAIIPNSWDETNPLWTGPRDNYPGISIGWAGTTTHRKDFEIVYPAVIQILEMYPQTRIVIGGDYDIYTMFKETPAARKLYLPMLPYNYYPLMLQHIDIWLAPLESSIFNTSKSNIKLIEAGARGIPWVASVLPPYVEWGKGGLFAKGPEDWFSNIAALVVSGELRQSLASSGHEEALKHTSAETGKLWVDLIQSLS